MSREPYANALQTSLTEIEKAYPGIHHSFLFTTNQNIITGNPENNQKTTENLIESFQNLQEKAKTIGKIKSLNINTSKGKIALNDINEMYHVMATSRDVDETQTYTITNLILPIIMKTIKTVTSTTNLQPPNYSKELTVDTLGGFFAGDSVQIDLETLIEMTKNNQSSTENITHVTIETLDGNSITCKVKEIDDQKVKGKKMIRIPEKLCNNLEIKKGDLIKVKPIN